MNKLYTYILLFLSINMYYVNAQTCAGASDIYSFNYNGHNYLVVKEKKSWMDAAACAVARKGYLAEINDAAENAAIFNALTSTNAGINTSLTTPIASVVLYDLTGKIVFSLATEAIPKPIDVSQFVTGIYLAEIFAQNGNTFVQRVKN